MGKVKLIPELRFPGFEGEWEEKNIGDVCEIKTGDKDTQNKQEEGLYPFFVRSDNVEKINTYSFDGEAILTSGDGVGVGKNFHYIVGKFDFHQRVYCLRNFKTEISGKYVYFVFSEKFYQRAIKYSAKNSVDSVRMEMISKMKLFFPSLPEQTRIATFLTSIDRRISLLIQKKEKLVCYKQGVMQKIFSQELRFKDEDGKDFPEWEEKRLGELGNTFNGLTGKTKEDFGKGKPYIQYMQIFSSSKININHFGFVDILESDNQNRVQRGDVFFTTSSETPNEIGTASVLVDEVGEVYLNSFCFGFRPNSLDELTPEFAKYLFRSENVRTEIVKLAQGSTRYNMSKVELMKLLVSLPSNSEQQKIASFLTALDQQIEKVDAQIDEMKGWKKGLLQKMFV